MTATADTTVDYYRLLGISSEATDDEIRAAYRGKLRLWHPDLVAGETEHIRRAANEMTVQLNEAYECLSDPDRRTAYETNSRSGHASTRHTSTSLLAVSPRTLRCDVTPGDTVRLTLNVRAGSRPGGDGLRVRVSEPLVAATFAVTAQAGNSAELEVRLDTSELGAHRSYDIPIMITWGQLTGTARLVVRTAELPRTSTLRSRRRPTSSSRRHRTRRTGRRVRDLTTISLGGIVLPLLVLAWASGLSPVPMTANSPLVAGVCAGVVAATTWLLTSSRLLRQPDRLSRIGVIWKHMTRWSGWILVGGCAIFLGIPAMALTFMAVVSVPLLGFVVIAFISGRFDSQHR